MEFLDFLLKFICQCRRELCADCLEGGDNRLASSNMIALMVLQIHIHCNANWATEILDTYNE